MKRDTAHLIVSGVNKTRKQRAWTPLFPHTPQVLAYDSHCTLTTSGRAMAASALQARNPSQNDRR
mgnify:CR=1 FL=1